MEIEIGTSLAHNEPILVDEDARARGVYVIGATGTGKSILLENMLAQMIEAGEGLCFVDPHGQSAHSIVAQIPQSRADDLVFIDLAEQSSIPSLNFMADIPPQERPAAASNVVAAFKHAFPDSWGPRMEYVFVCAVRSLMDRNLTLLALPKLFNNQEFRFDVVRGVDDPYIRYFWHNQYQAWSKKLGPELTAPIENKVGAVLSNPILRAIVGVAKNTIDIRAIMDGRKILVISLSKGQTGEEPARLFGGLVVSAIVQAAFARSAIHESDRIPFTGVFDEFQNFATDAFPLILSEARKYKLQLVLAHQGLFQTKEQIMNAVFANCGTFVSLRLGIDDAPPLAKLMQFSNAGALLDLPNYQAWVRPLQNGAPATPLRIATHPPRHPLHNKAPAFIVYSKRRLGRARADIDELIARFLEGGTPWTPNVRSQKSTSKVRFQRTSGHTQSGKHHRRPSEKTGESSPTS